MLFPFPLYEKHSLSHSRRNPVVTSIPTYTADIVLQFRLLSGCQHRTLITTIPVYILTIATATSVLTTSGLAVFAPFPDVLLVTDQQQRKFIRLTCRTKVSRDVPSSTVT